MDKLILQCTWEIQEEVFGMQLKIWVCAQETLQGWSHEHRVIIEAVNMAEITLGDGWEDKRAKDCP